MNAYDWPDKACALLEHEAQIARIVVVALRGSAPREPGAVMLVTPDALAGTIGGGRLEWQTVARARELLAAAEDRELRIDDIVLGPQLGQCCGGRVLLYVERLDRRAVPALRAASLALRNGRAVQLRTLCAAGRATRHVTVQGDGSAPPPSWQPAADGGVLRETLRRPQLQLMVFGAGHVGHAVVDLLRALPHFDITWIDTRTGVLPDWNAAGLRCIQSVDAVALATAAPAGAHYLVFTHDHGLDYELCRAVLGRGDAAWLGLIGSASKRARFRSRLARDGFAAATIDRLTCPIGIADIHSKLPAAIAIGVAAQLLQLAERAEADAPPLVDQPAVCDGDCARCRQEIAS